MNIYIHQQDNWPNFIWDNEKFIVELSNARNLQGKLIGKMESLGFDLRNEATLDTLTLDVLKSKEIEGEILDPEQVRSPKQNWPMSYYKANTFAIKWEYQDMNADAFSMFNLDEEGKA